MLVVADASPLIALIEISKLEMLPALFATVIIPPEVMTELQSKKRISAVRNFAIAPPAWLQICSPSKVEIIPTLDSGETAAICLALELNASLLLIDEAKGRRAASKRHIPITGTIGVLELAADNNLLELEATFAQLKNSSFWVSEELIEKRLRIRRETRRDHETDQPHQP